VALLEAMMTSIADRASASAVVPIVISVPDESADKFTHLTFSEPLDETAGERLDKAIRRLALGLDAPPELLLGTGSMNHWGAWLVLEDVVTTHLEPPLALICDALTTQYFWPVVTGEGFGMAPEQAHQYVIWYDVSDLVVRPNRSTDAMGLFDKGALSQVALRRATGFDETDAPETIPQEAQIAIDAIKQAPSLLATVNLADLVAQIRAVLTGQPAPASSSPPAPAGTSPAEGAQPAQGQPSGGPSDVPTDQPQKGTGSVPAPESIAASGPRLAPETAPMGLPFGALGRVSMPDWMMADTEKIPLPDLSRAAELGGRGARARRRRD